MNQRRSFKIAEQLQASIATNLLNLSDPRLSLITITGVKVSSDLKIAKIYWMATNGKERQEEISDGLCAATGKLRWALGKDLNLRAIPQLYFFYDDTYDVQDEVNQLFSKISPSNQLSTEGDEPHE
jgi:ribosome-binding factor A